MEMVDGQLAAALLPPLCPSTGGETEILSRQAPQGINAVRRRADMKFPFVRFLPPECPNEEGNGLRVARPAKMQKGVMRRTRSVADDVVAKIAYLIGGRSRPPSLVPVELAVGSQYLNVEPNACGQRNDQKGGKDAKRDLCSSLHHLSANVAFTLQMRLHLLVCNAWFDFFLFSLSHDVMWQTERVCCE